MRGYTVLSTQLDYTYDQLTADQQNGYNSIVDFLLDPDKKIMVLNGFSGTGKSTLVRYIWKQLHKIIQMNNLAGSRSHFLEDIALTATTNQAAQNLAEITGKEVTTIHKHLGLLVFEDWETGETMIRAKDKDLHGGTIVIDEASFIDRHLMKKIFEKAPEAKILFIMDDCQLLNFKETQSIVAAGNFQTSQLEKVVRQAEGNPIVEMGTMFRNAVKGAAFQPIDLSQDAIQHVKRDQFDEMLLDSIADTDWAVNKSKLLSWTNATSIAYNNAIRNKITGADNFVAGDIAICNKYVGRKNMKINTDQHVLIEDASGLYTKQFYGPASAIKGIDVIVHNQSFFLPRDPRELNKVIKALRKDRQYDYIKEINSLCIDLRAAYASTVNKSQGSTYDTVFIDLDDIAKCSNHNQLCRMLYVGATRARHKVIFTGDLK